MPLFDQIGTPVELAGEVARGGEGTVYLVRGRPGQVAKILNERERTRERRDKLSAMLAHAPADPMRGQGHRSIAWPEELLFADDRGEDLAGFLMPRAAVGAFTPFVASQPEERQRVAPFFTFRHLLTICRNMAAALAAVNAAGHCVGDLHESNLLVTPEALVMLVDTDSFQVAVPGQRTFRCGVGKAEFTAPELAGRSLASTDRTPASDVYALAVLMFQMLMQGYHPYSGVLATAADGEPPPLAERALRGLYAYEDVPGVTPPGRAPSAAILPPALRAAFRLTFVASLSRPAIRPPAAQWVALLDQALGKLVECGRNPLHVYTDDLEDCPWCGLASRGPDFFPALAGLQRTLAGAAADQPARLELSARQIRFTAVVPAGASPSQTISYSNSGSGALRGTVRVEPEGLFVVTPAALERNQGKIEVSLATGALQWERSYRATLTISYNGPEPDSMRSIRLFADTAPALFIQRWLLAKVHLGQWVLLALALALGFWTWSQRQDPLFALSRWLTPPHAHFLWQHLMALVICCDGIYLMTRFRDRLSRLITAPLVLAGAACGAVLSGWLPNLPLIQLDAAGMAVMAGAVSSVPLLLHALMAAALVGPLRRWLLRGSRLRRWLAVAVLWAPGLGLTAVLGLLVWQHVAPVPTTILTWRSTAVVAPTVAYEVSAPLGTYVRSRKDCDALDAGALLPRGARVQLSEPRQNQPGDVPGPCAVKGWSRITHGWVPTDSIRPVMNSGGAN